MIKVTFSLSEETMDKINKYNEESHLPKSAIVTLAIEQYFQTRDVMMNMKDIVPLLQELKRMNDNMTK